MIDEEPEQAPLEGARVLDAHHGERQDALEDARRREEVGGADLAPVVGDRLGALGAVHAQPGQKGLRVGEDVVADPGDRQIGDDLVRVGQAVEAAADLGGLDGVVIAQHHAFGASGRAGGVEDDGEVRSPPRLELAGQHGGGLTIRGEAHASVVDDAGDRVQMRAVVVAQAALFVIENVPQRRQPIGHGEKLVHLLLILHGGMRDLRMLQDVGHLVGDCIRVDRNRHGAEPLRGGDSPVEARPVVADHGDLGAAPDAERLEADGIGANDLVHLRPGPGLPDPEILVPDRRPVRAHARVAHDQLRKGVLRFGCRRRHHRGPPWRRTKPALSPCARFRPRLAPRLS